MESDSTEFDPQKKTSSKSFQSLFNLYIIMLVCPSLVLIIVLTLTRLQIRISVCARVAQLV